MTSCTQPYYYIMNYNKIEGERKLHIDTIFGERNSIKLATILNTPDWETLIENMKPIKGEEVVLEAQDKFHFDVIEVTCNVPLLVNLFYTDPSETKVTLLETGDITILSLEKGKKETLTFKPSEKGPFVYSFTIDKDSLTVPRILITFDGMEEISFTKNGVYTKYSLNQYNNIVISNKDNSVQETLTQELYSNMDWLLKIFLKRTKMEYIPIKTIKIEYIIYMVISMTKLLRDLITPELISKLALLKIMLNFAIVLILEHIYIPPCKIVIASVKIILIQYPL